MRILTSTVLCLMLTNTIWAQPPRGGQGGERGERTAGARGGNNNSDPISRLMAMDKDQDGKLTEKEVTDRRLRSLFERADSDKDKTVTQDELTLLIDKESQSQNNAGSRMGSGGPRGPGGFGGRPSGPGDFHGGPGFGGPGFGGPGFGGPGGPGGPGFGGPGGRPAPMKPGTVLPEFMLGELHLSEEQRSEITKLQKLVDERLATILTSEQQAQLKQMGNGPEGFGPGGPRGPGAGGPDGAPPNR